jgi:hypothetical protein
MTEQEWAFLLADTVAAETRYRRQLGREMYEAGYRQAETDMAVRWDTIARAAVRGPALSEIEIRRWGPGGRKHFADPRPGDYPGRGSAAA